MIEAVEPEWLTFDEASALLGMPHLEVARLILSGDLRFRVVKRAPNRSLVLRMDVEVFGVDVRRHQRDRWNPAHDARVDELVNRAAMKFGRHPTRTTPGVRGRGRKSVKTKE